MKKIFTSVLIALCLFAATSCGGRGVKVSTPDVDSVVVVAEDSLNVTDSVVVAIDSIVAE